MKDVLAKTEASDLKRCEAVISRGMGTFVEVGQALSEIRDQKLYRATHKTFDAYCKERWDLGRARAYQLIEGAQTIKTIAAAAGADLSTAVDKIPEWNARELKADPVAAGVEIRERAARGEQPGDVAKDIANRARVERKSEPSPQARRSSPVQNQANDRAGGNEVSELEAIIEDLKAENAKLKGQVAAFEPMRLEYERGGFAEVIKGMGEQIRVLKTRVETESQEKVKNLRSAEFWKRKAVEAGYSRDAVIDLETLEEVKNG